MCAICGCGPEKTQAHIYDHPHEHIRDRPGPDGNVLEHAHDRPGPDGDVHEHHPGHLEAQDLGPTTSPAAADEAAALRRVSMEQSLLARNDALAAVNRQHFAAHRVLALNLVSSPGAGKTTLLVKTIDALRGRCPVSVIEGDQATSLDAERIRAAGAPAVQVNTGKGCHLDAAMVDRAFHRLPAPEGGVLLIENVGNLVCPAAFDLGEAARVVVLSVTEGDDKPLKYPDIFRGSALLVLTKVDLLPYVEFDPAACLAHARRTNPSIRALRVSARTGEGMGAWLDWITARLAGAESA